MPANEFGRGRRPVSLRGAAFYVAAISVAALFVVPLAWMVAASLRQPGLPPGRGVEWIPDPVSWVNYGRLFELLPVGRYLLNSVAVAAVAVPVTVVTASWAGYAMARLAAPIQRALAMAGLALLMVPITALWLARYMLFTWIGLVDNYGALLAPAVMGTSPLFVLLFYWAFRRQPAELWDSARLDGAGELTIWRRVALPLAGPTVMAVAALAFLVYWGDFINPLMYLKSPESYTLPVGIRQLQQLDRSNWPLLMAGAVLMTAPAIGVFLGVQKLFLREGNLA